MSVPEHHSKKIKIKWLALPILTGLVFILSNISQYFPVLNLFGLMRGLLLTLGIITALFILLSWIIRNSVRASLVLTLLLIPTFFAFDLQFWSQLFGLGGMIPIIALVVLSLSAVIRTLLRKSEVTPLYRLTGAFIMLLFLHQVLYAFFTFSRFTEDRSNYLEADIRLSMNTRMTYALDSLPDIYYFVFDAHTSYESLSKYWAYGDRGFINSLKSKGFFVAEQAQSNYDQTPYSMASIWNMSPLKEKEIHLKNSFPYLMSITGTIQSNPVYRAFTELGYEFTNLSIFDIGPHPKYYRYGLQKEIQSFSDLIWHRTIFGLINDYVIKSGLIRKWKLNALKKRHSHLPAMHHNILDSLAQIMTSEPDQPKFIYAHFMLPHHPYYLDKNGTEVNDPGEIFPESTPHKMRRYLDQLIYIDREIDRVTAVLENTGRPTIIVIQGDHGFRELEDPEHDQNERKSILYAIKVPDQNYSGMSPKVSSMYTFRWLLERHFRLKWYD